MGNFQTWDGLVQTWDGLVQTWDGLVCERECFSGFEGGFVET